MTVMFRKAFWDMRWTTFWYAVGGGIYVFAIGLFFPTIREQAETFQKLIGSYPKGLLTLLGYTDIVTFSGFMGTETLNLILPAVFIVFATLSGGAVVAKEIEDGTGELLFSLPAHRWRLLLAKMAALAVALLAMVSAVIVALVAAAITVGETLSLQGVLALAAVMTAFLFAIAAYTCLFSAVTSSRGQAAGISLAVTLATYLIWVIASLSEPWRWLKDLSIFAAYTPQEALASGRLDVVPLSLLAALTAVSVVAALVAFERRDAVG